MTREKIFIQMLEGLHVSEANLVINAKDKKLHQVYKGLSNPWWSKKHLVGTMIM